MQGHHNHLLQHRLHDRLQSMCSFLSAPSFPPLILSEGGRKNWQKPVLPGVQGCHSPLHAGHFSALLSLKRPFPCTLWCFLMETVLPPCNPPLPSACQDAMPWPCTALWCFPTSPQQENYIKTSHRTPSSSTAITRSAMVSLDASAHIQHRHASRQKTSWRAYPMIQMKLTTPAQFSSLFFSLTLKQFLSLS